jgi:hypothetical protein
MARLLVSYRPLAHVIAHVFSPRFDPSLANPEASAAARLSARRASIWPRATSQQALTSRQEWDLGVAADVGPRLAERVAEAVREATTL